MSFKYRYTWATDDNGTPQTYSGTFRGYSLENSIREVELWFDNYPYITKVTLEDEGGIIVYKKILSCRSCAICKAPSK